MSKFIPIDFSGIRLHTEFVQQAVGQLHEPLQTNLPGIEEIERELQGGEA